VDRHARGDDAAGRVDVQVDDLLGVLGLEEQHLGHDHVGHVVVDAADQEDHPLLEQPRVDVVGALAAAGLFDHHRNEVEGPGLVAHGFGSRLRVVDGWRREGPAARYGTPAEAGEPAYGVMASWNVSCCSVCWARSAIQSITCSSITRFCSPDINWGSLRYKSMTCCGSS